MINKRKCIATGEKLEKEKLIRIVKFKNKIQVDQEQILPGRGCYIKRDESVITKLGKQKLLHKSFKTNVKKEVYDELINTIKGV